MRLELLEEAEDELREAILYYEDRQDGLGSEFFGRVTEMIAAIRVDPERFPLYEGKRMARKFRRVRVRRFPYLLVFEVRTDKVLVVAVAHTRRRPGYWANRGAV